MTFPYKTWRPVLLIVLATLLCPNCPSLAQDSGQESTEELWLQTREFLFNREYGLAINYLENCSNDEWSANQSEQFRKDIAAITKLQQLEVSVKQVVDSLAAGTKLNDGGRDLTFVGVDANPAGKGLKFKTNNGREVKTTLKKLRAATWLKLVENMKDSPAKDDFTVGIFLAFDRMPKLDEARAKLNSAANSGEDVDIWIRRLTKTADSPINAKTDSEVKRDLVGTWRLNFQGKKYDGNVTFKRNGSTSSRMVKKWKRMGKGEFELTFARNIEFKVVVFGDRLWGRGPRGRMSGVRIK